MANEPGNTKVKGSFNWQEIIMNEQHNFDKDKLTLEFLESKLRSFKEVNVPVTLKEKLLNTRIPVNPRINVLIKLL